MRARSIARFFVALGSVAVAAVSVGGAGACAKTKSPPLPVQACDARHASPAMDEPALADIDVSVEGSGAAMDLVRADYARVLSAMWGAPVTVSAAAPSLQKPITLWVSSSDAARARFGQPKEDGYVIRRDGGVVVVWAKDAGNLAHGAYALLEELGARFFHPKEELLPKRGRPAVPKSLDLARRPLAAQRGLQLHLLHPIEYWRPFNEPGAQNLADAKLVIDWLVKTGQNFVQWPVLQSFDFEAWRPHAQAILDYAHARGVRAGVLVQLWGGASLQNAYVLVKDAAQWQAQMDAQLDRVLSLPWDVLELAMGEFISSDPQNLIDWMSHATDHALAARPGLEVNAQNHVGNYKNLFVPYKGQTVFFYHLPQFADARLGQSVHTLSFFDLYRDWATYAHPDFHLQHDFLLAMLKAGRRALYFPESAYWVTNDVDVPAFLPMYLQARYNDVHGLSKELAEKGLPPLRGHTIFSSGHEWGYWMTDYLTAKMLWNADAPFDTFVGDYAAAYGTCAGDVKGALLDVTNLETRYLFDQRLAAYISGEDNVVDFGYLAGLETHPKRVPFEDVAKMDPGARATFESKVIGGLEAMAGELAPIEDHVAAICRGSDDDVRPWCDELWDGIAIVRLRAQHAAHLYRAALNASQGKDGHPELSLAQGLTGEAAKVIARREAKYRFDPNVVAGAYDNPTIYAFGYLRQAHTQCFWTRREAQVQYLLENGGPAGLLSLDTCDK